MISLSRGKSAFTEEEAHSIQGKIGYTFQDIRYLNDAFRIKSSNREKARRFDLMEKAGDAVLKTAIVSLLMHKYHTSAVGDISRMESIITCNDNLAHMATRLKLHEIIYRNAPSGILSKKILADTVEALLGAIALDAGRGDFALGMSDVVPICQHLFSVELEIAQINSPARRLRRVLDEKSFKPEDITFRVLCRHYHNSVIGMVCKYHFRSKRLKRLLNCDYFGGTGYSSDAAINKTSALILLQLEKHMYNSPITLEDFSWKIRKPITRQ